MVPNKSTNETSGKESGGGGGGANSWNGSAARAAEQMEKEKGDRSVLTLTADV